MAARKMAKTRGALRPDEEQSLQEAKQALALLDAAALEPTMDELAHRARAATAQQFPDEAGLRVMVEKWRRDRASWGAGKKEVEGE